MNWLMLPIFTSPTFAIGATRIDARLLARQSSLNRVFLPKFLTVLRRGSAPPGCLASHQAEELSRRANKLSLSRGRKGSPAMSDRGSLGRFVHKDELENYEVIIERDETAKQREHDEPEQTVVWTGA